ncbi:MAG: WG repeat-containing protein [Lewinellaceae bacterium]|nr:WG repeat-containing protein [Lewinellaceae bacterium]
MGIHRNRGEQLFKPKFSNLASAGLRDYFKVKIKPGDPYWGLCNPRGKLILDCNYQNIIALSDIMVAAWTGRVCQLINLKNPPLDPPQKFLKKLLPVLNKKRRPAARPALTMETVRKCYPGVKKKFFRKFKMYPEYENIIPLNSRWAVLEPLRGPDTLQLWHIGKGKVKRDYHRHYEKLDERFFLGLNGSKQVELMDTSGNKVPNTLYDAIRVSALEGWYFARKNASWGVISQQGDVVRNFTYDAVFEFKDSIAVCKTGSKTGAINALWQEIPCIYDSLDIQYDIKRIDAYESGNLTEYAIGPGGKFIRGETFDKPIPKNTNYAVIEKKSRKKVNQDTLANRALISLAQIVDRKDKTGLRLSTQNKRWYLPDSAKIKGLNLREFTEVLVLIPDSLFVLYTNSRSVVTRPVRDIFEQGISYALLFDIRNRQILPAPPMVGILPFAKGVEYTAFMDTTGRMGLIDRHGRQMMKNGRPLRYTYIGPFSAGRARVCSGGALESPSEYGMKDPVEFRIGERAAFARNLNIRIPQRDQSTTNTIVPSALGNTYIHAMTAGKSEPQWGYIDQNGEEVVPPRFEYAEDFSARFKNAFVLRRNNKVILNRIDADYGMIDLSGKLTVPIIYSTMQRHDDYVQVTADSTPTFYFNKKGHQIIENPTKARPFREGLTFLRGKNNLWGFADTTGKVVIKPQFNEVRPFSEGIAAVVDTSGNWIFINKTGNVIGRTPVPQAKWFEIGDFHSGMCWYRENKKWGCYRKDGTIAFVPQFSRPVNYETIALQKEPPKRDSLNPYPMDFSQGAATVFAFDSLSKKEVPAVIDSAGEFLVKPGVYLEISPFNVYGLAVFAAANKLLGVLDHHGDTLCGARYMKIGEFREGFARVLAREGWGLINSKGKQVIRPSYDDMGDFVSEGRIAVKKRGLWTFADTSGFELSVRFETQPPPFQNGVCFAQVRNKAFIINRAGGEVPIRNGRPEFFSDGFFGVGTSKGFYYSDAYGSNLFGRFFSEIRPYSLGVARVKLNDGQGSVTAINQRGVIIVPTRSKVLHVQPDGNIIINPQRFFGMFSQNGRPLLEADYDRITRYDQNIFRVDRAEAIGYFRLKGEQIEWVWPLKY